MNVPGGVILNETSHSQKHKDHVGGVCIVRIRVEIDRTNRGCAAGLRFYSVMQASTVLCIGAFKRVCFMLNVTIIGSKAFTTLPGRRGGRLMSIHKLP